MPLSQRAAELLRLVHDEPGITRADASRRLGMGSGVATDVVAGLVAHRFVAERAAEPTGGRGRPTTELVAHPDGPLVLAVSLTLEDWRIRAVALGGTSVAEVADEHTGRPSAEVVADLAAAVARLRRRFPRRVRAIAASAPGTVEGTRIRHATSRHWRDVDLRAAWPRAPLFVAGNDATLAGAAEATRGAAVGAAVSLHLRVRAGIGGAVVDHGRVLTGAHGLGGEFGHVPFGDPALECPCGASGCWGASVDGTALARLVGDREPKDPDAYMRRTVERARHDPVRARAVHTVATAFGRGVAGLVNAVDPDAVTLGGSGVDLLAAEPEAIDSAYRAGLMRTKRGDPPPLQPAALGEDGPLVGAAELAWDAVWPHL